MLSYNNIYFGNDPKESEKFNFLNILEELNFAIKEKALFFLISSDIVFDREQDKVYTEKSNQNSNTLNGKFLIEAEKKVLNYSKGFIIRIQDDIKRFIPLFNEMLKFNEIPNLHKTEIHLVSEGMRKFFVDKLMEYRYIDFDRKIIHLYSPNIFNQNFIWFSLKNESCTNDEDIKCSFNYPILKGGLKSLFLKDIPFYNLGIEENVNYINKYFSSFGEKNE